MKIIKKILVLFIIIRLIGAVIAGLGSDGLEVISGQWDVDSNKNIYITDNSGKAISILEEEKNTGYVSINFTIKISQFKNENGFVIFDYNSKDNFKYAGIREKNNKIVIGEYENGKFKDSITQTYEIDPEKNYFTKIIINKSQVFLYFDNKEKISKIFPLKLNQKIGFSASRAKTIFKNVQINTKNLNYSPVFQDIYKVIPQMSGTGLDKMGEIILNDKGLQNKIPETDILEGVYYSNKMNKIILEAIKTTGVANDEKISSLDVKILDEYVYNNYLQDWIFYHGDDQNGDENGFHIVQNDGAITKIYNQNAVNTVIDGIYHLGFGSANSKKIQNEDRNNNQKYSDLSKWINGFLKEDLKKSILKNNSLNNFGYKYKLVKGEDYSKLKNLYLSNPIENGILILDESFNSNSKIKFKIKGTSWEKNKNGFIIFDYKNTNNFKYAGIRIDKNSFVIGEFKNGKFYNKISKIQTLKTNIRYNLSIQKIDNKIILYENSREKINYKFKSKLNEKIGFLVDKSTSIFSSDEFFTKKSNSFFYSFFSKFNFF